MIAKLMKYDIKKISKLLVYLYGAALISAGVTRFIYLWKDIQVVAILGYIFSGMTYSLIASILVNTFVQILRVFINNFYKDESYLTHTLPVDKHHLLLSKFLSGLVVIFSSVLVCFASLFILFYSKEFVLGLTTFIETMVSSYNMSTAGFISLLVLLIFAQICSLISMSFAATVKANTYNKKRVSKGLLWFLVFYFGSMNATLLSVLIVFAITGNLSQFLAATLSQTAFITISIVGLISYIFMAVLFYILCDKWFKKGVNVD